LWNTRPVWSRDGTKIATSDWRFDDDATEDVIEFTVADGTTRRLTSRPKAYDSPLAYTTDGRVLFASLGQNARIVQVSVARLLTQK
jgi:tricorn protease-like protein